MVIRANAVREPVIWYKVQDTGQLCTRNQRMLEAVQSGWRRAFGRCREDGRERNEQAIWGMLFTRRRDFPPRAMARGERVLAGRRRGRKVAVEACGSALASSKSGVDLPISDNVPAPRRLFRDPRHARVSSGDTTMTAQEFAISSPRTSVMPLRKCVGYLIVREV